MNTPQMQHRPDEDPRQQHEPRFSRERFLPAARELDRFFDSFVPLQYEQGFSWRCQIIGQGEQQRAKPFDQQPERIQKIIAGNAEILLELLVETGPLQLDLMRAAGKILATLDIQGPDSVVDADIPVLREDMARRHHEKWLAQFKADIESGRRSDHDHRGAKAYDELPEIERQILKVQTWANWKVLGALGENEYGMLRDISERRLFSQPL